LEILRYLYVSPADPVLLMILHQKFKRQRLCSNRATIWNPWRKLERMGMIRILHGNSISLWPSESVNPETGKLLVARCDKSLLGEFYPGEHDLGGGPPGGPEGEARLENHITTLHLKVDLSDCELGQYFLGVRPKGWEWTYCPLVVK